MMVSVCMITYGHERYIKQAIEGVLMQECNFDVELIIADDCSPDSTAAIITSIQKNHSNSSWINYSKHTKNKGMMPNFMWALEQCQGKYVALCEGDDYWTDPLKLQKQVDFLETNAEFNYCGHQSSVLTNGILKEVSVTLKEFTFKELIFSNLLNTATLLIRKKAIIKLPVFFNNIPAGDWALQLVAIKDSKAFVFCDNMSVYRMHSEGIWSHLDKRKMCMQGVKTIEAFKVFYKDNNSKKLINEAIIKRKIKFGIYKPSLFVRGVNKFKSYF
ncbi:glycosyltransferase family 2 protein [Winogradskyella wichelsiae]|uniref:glycosyltransferase family 2 protein n=1 Tax=Winogradskyella wichelsiae TaxID=2697007 RepID=UPI003EF424A2